MFFSFTELTLKKIVKMLEDAKRRTCLCELGFGKLEAGGW